MHPDSLSSFYLLGSLDSQRCTIPEPSLVNCSKITFSNLMTIRKVTSNSVQFSHCKIHGRLSWLKSIRGKRNIGWMQRSYICESKPFPSLNIPLSFTSTQKQVEQHSPQMHRNVISLKRSITSFYVCMCVCVCVCMCMCVRTHFKNNK